MELVKVTPKTTHSLQHASPFSHRDYMRCETGFMADHHRGCCAHVGGMSLSLNLSL